MTYNKCILCWLALFSVMAACNQPSTETSDKVSTSDTLSVPDHIHVVVGIGKVLPKQGLVNLASPTGGIVKSVLKESGDSVHRGEPVVVLRQKADRLKIEELKNQITTQQQEVASNRINVEQLQTQLNNKKDKWAVSKKLAKTGAETRENVVDLQTEKKVLKAKLAKAHKEVDLSRSKVNELQSKLETAKNELAEKTIKAVSSGVLLTIDAKVGSAVQSLDNFATYAPDGPWIIHGEADEMFANRLAIGQKVEIHYIGNKHIITTGKIISLSPDLSNKSLFTDEPGEQQDRRVRRFKVLLDNKDHLLINSKVECNIHLNK